MAERIISPRGRGFLLLDAHPTGCERTVREVADEIPAGPAVSPLRRPVALIIGSSGGYGLATTVAAIVGQGMDGVGVCFERPATARLSASAGWYRIRELAALAAQHGSRFEFVNGDCFLDETKQRVLDRLAEIGPVDYLIYSVAAPRRTDPATGITYASVIKTLDGTRSARTLAYDTDGRAMVTEAEVAPATAEEQFATVKVMGGEDWRLWVDALAERDLLAPGFTTVALSYIGSELTADIYRRGTIGAAKEHLEDTARGLSAMLQARGARAYTSVNGAAVTQASTHIPGVSYYAVLLRDVLGDGLNSPAQQSARLWRQLVGDEPLTIDELGRIRLDDFELDPTVQAEIAKRWAEFDSTAIADRPATAWFHDEVLRLFGFAVAGVDYEQPVEVDLPWPGTT